MGFCGIYSYNDLYIGLRIEPFCQDELALYRQCAENRDKVLRVRLQESEHKLGMSMPIDLAKERITQLEAKATSLERYSFSTLQRYSFRLKISV
ncbi:hypothetical protein F2Q70_00016987, partial [Brassica cretica]